MASTASSRVNVKVVCLDYCFKEILREDRGVRIVAPVRRQRRPPSLVAIQTPLPAGITPMRLLLSFLAAVLVLVSGLMTGTTARSTSKSANATEGQPLTRLSLAQF